MDYLAVNGGSRLGGSIRVHGAKNSVLPILCAAALINGEAVIHNCPKLSDVENTVLILKYLGADVRREGSTLIVNAKDINKTSIPCNMMEKMRSSVLFLGALSSRLKTAKACLPGGCEIGLRPIDLHLKGFAELSCTVSYKDGIVTVNGSDAKASEITLPFPSVGATENIILASVFLNGKTVIINAAREPEISDLCSFLNGAGAKISGAGSSIIEITGVKSLGNTEHTVIPDRILASTYMCAAAATGSTLQLNSVDTTSMQAVFDVFQKMGCRLYLGKRSLKIEAPERIKRVKGIVTKPYPAFPTDCQAPVCAVLSAARGKSEISETVFENRFRYINELSRFGADITVNGNAAIIRGVKKLSGAKVSCTDLRGGAALVIAALAAEGSSQIRNISHLDRGYEALEEKLPLIGADVKRFKDEKEFETRKEKICRKEQE